jgi:hypothetical protein
LWLFAWICLYVLFLDHAPVQYTLLFYQLYTKATTPLLPAASCCSANRRPMSSVTMRAAAVEAPAAPVLPYRVGHGFDLHRLAEGYKLIIGGIEIPHTKGCEAHSDGAACCCSAQCVIFVV